MIKKPRILVLAHEQSLNGASHSLITILEGLNAMYEFLVIVPDNGLMVDELKRISVSYVILNLPRCAYFNYNSFSDHLKHTLNYYKNKKTLERKLLLTAQKFLPDLIYTNTSVLSLGYDLSIKVNKPHIWHIREYGDIDFKIQYLPSRNTILKKIKKSHTAIFTTHLLKQHWLGVKPYNSNVVYNGIFEFNNNDLSKVKSKETIVIGVIGMILNMKGQKFALKIFNECYKKNRSIKMNFYGGIADDQFYQELKKYIEVNNLTSAVTFLGYLPKNDIYKEIDVLLSCSTNEAFGRTLIEGMVESIPVLARNTGGPSEILKTIEYFSLYDNLEEAIFKLNKLIANSDFYFESTKRGYDLAKTNFSKQKYLSSTDEIFKKALNE